MKTSYDKLAKFYTKCFGHITMMAATFIYGKNPLKVFFYKNQKANDLGTWYVAFGV